MAIIAWLQANLSSILIAVVALDTALAQVPMIKANSTFQLVSGWISSLASFILPKPPTA